MWRGEGIFCSQKNVIAMLICPSHADLFRIWFDASHKVRMAPKEKKIVQKKQTIFTTQCLPSSHLDMAAMSWLRDTENLEATVGAFFLVDVAAEEEEPPGSSLENRAEMNWVEVGWKEGQR